jgi:hypothetical protein
MSPALGKFSRESPSIHKNKFSHVRIGKKKGVVTLAE